MTILFGTFGRYVFQRFLVTISAVFVVVFLLIFTIDLVEVFRSAASSRNVSVLTIISLAVMRTPAVAENVIPFATLFGAMIAFLNLSRRLELVVIRAAGVSAWQFIAPALAAAGLLGMIAVLAFNPLSSHLKSQANDLSFKSLRGSPKNDKEVWFRQKTETGSAVIRGFRGATNEPRFVNFTLFSFDPDGRFIERYQAAEAELVAGVWRLRSVQIIASGIETRQLQDVEIPSSLTADQVQQSLTAPETISFYELPDWTRRLTSAGLDASRYAQQYHSLIAKPFLLMAMILVAASVSLGFSRFGASGRAILAGVVCGFGLYVVNKISSDLGAIGTISTFFAAFFPPVLASLIGILALLHQEDG